MTNTSFYPQILDRWQKKFTGITVDSDTFLEFQNPLVPLDTCFLTEGITFAVKNKW